ncbi:MAG: CotS family spore coat protein [Paenibacillus sp.]|nr:CotS family spore coat protein [Paenibacillus sp.]
MVENYQIVPWAGLALSPDVVHEQYVPPELEMMARQVMEHYDMQVHEMVLITSKPDKGGAIWKISTDKGNRSIKVLHRRPQRSLFSIGAQEYMAGQGYRVPSFILTKEGNYYVEAGGKLWIVTEWIEPLLPVSKIDLEGAAELCFGLGEFHKNSKGYVPPFGSEKSSRLYSWAKYYEKIIAKIGWFRDIAKAYPETAASASLLAVVDEFERQANEIFERFKTSPYPRMIAKGEPHWGLVHQDYGWSNGQMGPGGIWVIDLDGVSFDLPIRDLRKLITSTMDDMGVWDLTWIRGMIDAYHQANPLDQETFEILWLDMAFPNEFYKHVKEIVFEPVTFLQTELEPILQRVMATETSKWQALTELEMDKSKYPAGDYTLEEAQPFFFDRSYRVLPGDIWLPDPVTSDLLATEDSTTQQPGLVPDDADAAVLQPVNAEVAEAQTPSVAAEPVPAAHVPAMPEVPQPPVFNPAIPALITQPAPGQQKFTLHIPKRRSSASKSIKKTGKPKRKIRKKILKFKQGSGIKRVRRLKKPLLKKAVKPVIKLKKRNTKCLKDLNKRKSKCLTLLDKKKRTKCLKDLKKTAHPLKKKQLNPRQKTA